MSRATLQKKPTEVASMFDGVAKRYDVTNTILSGGQDLLWRRETRRALQLSPGDVVLDLAAGTGVSTAELSKSGAFVVAADFSQGMLRAGMSRKVPMVTGDAMALPFADDSFDAATISFGLRNVVDVGGALLELRRVVKPGGRLVICDFSTPTWRPFRRLYMNYLMRALPLIATKVSSNPDAYVYLADSIRVWPNQFELSDMMYRSGWSGVRWKNLTGGIAALHIAHN